MKPVLIIDPGHGGADPGGGSNDKWVEKDLVLQISLYQLKRYRELGIPVALTRNTDQTVTPNRRVRTIRVSGARYCHSNHINAGGGDGAELIHSIYSDGKMAKSLATRLKKSGQNVRRIFTRTLPNNKNKDYYFMNRETGEVETIIIEYGFADSVKDDRTQLEKNWEMYAEAVVEGFCAFAGYSYCVPTRQGNLEQDKPWYIGKRLVSKVDNLRYYREPSWEDNACVNTINKGIGFPEIAAKITVGTGAQYKVLNSKGEIYYITAHEKYVHVE
ncbi:N-acetylmuramoyl-L-alanine amidase [Paraliobacillus sediminis]|uniref:N-acetylmuramoyl-L-alanine amidase n=1 Tax=Paraliobacillus sediminis TaxID=1885916 RepID=UPI0023DDDE76|nr:N-acetylmuramoyl-L-alanine amidase [Paraliobacillus sediminis]